MLTENFQVSARNNIILPEMDIINYAGTEILLLNKNMMKTKGANSKMNLILSHGLIQDYLYNPNIMRLNEINPGCDQIKLRDDFKWMHYYNIKNEFIIKFGG